MSQAPLQRDLAAAPGPSGQSVGVQGVRWRSGEMLIMVFGVALAIVFLRHGETTARWADRPLLPRLMLWLPFMAVMTLYIRRRLMDAIKQPVPVGVFLLIGVTGLLGLWLPLAWAHAAMLTALLAGIGVWGKWTGLRFILPTVILLVPLRPIPGSWETA
ncbi:MAG: hypothetical protein ACIAXF_16390, partial [Phycisphaerales bacterium JB063]